MGPAATMHPLMPLFRGLAVLGLLALLACIRLDRPVLALLVAAAFAYPWGAVLVDGASRLPWLDELIPEGEDMSLTIECEAGTFNIGGVGCLNSYKSGIAEMPGFALNQGAAKYTWDDQTAYGMVERSVLKDV